VEALDILKKIEGIGIVELNSKDVMRHKLVEKIINAYEKNSKNKLK
jgi:phosphate starvation-inducible PhoH-like protein